MQEKGMMQRGRHGVEKALKHGLVSAADAAAVETELEAAANSRDTHKLRQLQHECATAAVSTKSGGQCEADVQADQVRKAIEEATSEMEQQAAQPTGQTHFDYDISEDELAMI